MGNYRLMSILAVPRPIAECVEAGVDHDKALALTAMFCRTTACLLSDQGYGVNPAGYTPVVTLTPIVIPTGKSLTMAMNIADQNSVLAEKHTARSMTPFIMHLHTLEKAGLGNLDQPKGTKKLVLEFDPAALLVLYKGIIGTHYPQCYTGREVLLDIEAKILGPSV